MFKPRDYCINKMTNNQDNRITKSIISVSQKNIQPGIIKYDGVLDEELASFFKHAKLNYIPYRFKDNRILLVLPNNLGAFLYANKEVLLETLDLEC